LRVGLQTPRCLERVRTHPGFHSCNRTARQDRRGQILLSSETAHCSWFAMFQLQVCLFVACASSACPYIHHSHLPTCLCPNLKPWPERYFRGTVMRQCWPAELCRQGLCSPVMSVTGGACNSHHQSHMCLHQCVRHNRAARSRWCANSGPT
jgi:hypothetical protein